MLIISSFIISPLLVLVFLHRNNSTTLEEKKKNMEANNDITKKNKVYPKDASDNNIPKQENSYNHLLYHIIKTRNINFIKNYF